MRALRATRALLCILLVTVGGSGVALGASEADAGDGAAGVPAVQPLPSFDTVKARHHASELAVLDRRGEPVAALRTDFSERRGAWVPLSEVSPVLQRAVLLSEDRRFQDHGGVDWFSLASAGWGWLRGEGMRGASTISMQLAAMFDDSLQRPSGGRSVVQKFDQVRRAWQLESAWSKPQILEAYLNLAAFRGELRGVEAVSRVMFAKHPHGLNPRESAVAAALLRGPNAAPGLVVSRACALLREMAQGDTCEGLASDVRRWLGSTARPAADAPQLAPHFARWAASMQGPSGREPVLHTTLDAALQRQVLRSVARHVAGMGHAQLTDAAVVVLDNDTGEVLAYVGASGQLSSARLVDHARARRQAGSTLKPFLYALALESRYLTAASLLDDAPLDLATTGGLYVPQNYDRSHAGLVSVRTALAASLNVPAVRTLMLVGVERFAQRLRALGLPLPHDADHYGFSLSLGSADVDLLSLTAAYRALADGGRWLAPQARKGQVKAQGRQVVDPLAAWIVGDILSDRGARARTFRFESPLATRHWAAVKTGTSKDMRDNWAVGWSVRYTVGVWVGNSAGLSMRDVSGVSGAAPIWHEVMAALHASATDSPPVMPHGLQRQQVSFAGNLEAPRTEYFLPGTAISRVEPAVGSEGRARIVSPAAGTILALDPDMPPANQRLALKASLAQEADEPPRWRVGSTLIGHGPEAYWQPLPGRHRIVLEDALGAQLDAVTVQVRDLPLARRQ